MRDTVSLKIYKKLDEILKRLDNLEFVEENRFYDLERHLLQIKPDGVPQRLADDPLEALTKRIEMLEAIVLEVRNSAHYHENPAGDIVPRARRFDSYEACAEDFAASCAVNCKCSE